MTSNRVLRPSKKIRYAEDATFADARKPREGRRRRTREDPWIPNGRSKHRGNNRAPRVTHYTCRICAEELHRDHFVPYLSENVYRKYYPEIPLACVSHLCRRPGSAEEPVCRDCIGQSMSARFELLGARSVAAGCLETGCKTPWDAEFIVNFFPAGPSREQYNLDMMRVWVDDGKVMTCIDDSCRAQGLPDDEARGYPQVQCVSPACKLRFCAVCLVPWHKDLTCAEYGVLRIDPTMDADEKVTLEMMQVANAKRCPNCFLLVDKYEGCSNVLCSGCNKYFDWEKAAPLRPVSKKPVPAQQQDPYWNWIQPVICEMDKLEGEGAA